MKVFITNLTQTKVSDKALKQFAHKYLASQKAQRIIELSVVFISPKQAEKINQQFRKKDYVPAVLTFPNPLSEILICPQQAKRNGESIEMLFKHGLNHLLGKHHK